MTTPDASSTRSGQAFAIEPTEIGPQSLVSGVAPISVTDRLAWRAAAPLAAKKPQRPPETPVPSACLAGSRGGLFDMAARDQLSLFDQLPTPSSEGGG